jgi:hypothetical protein
VRRVWKRGRRGFSRSLNVAHAYSRLFLVLPNVGCFLVRFVSFVDLRCADFHILPSRVKVGGEESAVVRSGSLKVVGALACSISCSCCCYWFYWGWWSVPVWSGSSVTRAPSFPPPHLDLSANPSQQQRSGLTPSVLGYMETRGRTHRVEKHQVFDVQPCWNDRRGRPKRQGSRLTTTFNN